LPGQTRYRREFVERLKRSRTIAIEATDAAHQKLSLSFSLADFAQAYDGPESPPPKVREEIVTGEKMKKLMKQPEDQKKASECNE
jgi:hypothetical protein